MCLQRTGQRSWRRIDVDNDRAAQIQSCEFVEVLLGNVETVADEDQRRAHRRCRIDAHAEVRSVTERERLRLTLSLEGQARLRLDDLARLELHRLDVAVDSCWFQPG